MVVDVLPFFPGPPHAWSKSINDDRFEDITQAQLIYIRSNKCPTPGRYGEVTEWDGSTGCGVITSSNIEPKEVVIYWRSMSPAYAHIIPKVGDFLAFDIISPATGEKRHRAKNVMILGDGNTEYVTTLDKSWVKTSTIIMDCIGEKAPVTISQSDVDSGERLEVEGRIRFRLAFNSTKGNFYANHISLIKDESQLERAFPIHKHQVAGPNGTNRKYVGCVDTYHAEQGWGFLRCNSLLIS